MPSSAWDNIRVYGVVIEAELLATRVPSGAWERAEWRLTRNFPCDDISQFTCSLPPSPPPRRRRTPSSIRFPEIKIDRKDPVLYEKDIEPIFANKCFVCHSGRKSSSGKFDMSTLREAHEGRQARPAVVAGKSAESYFYKFCSRQKKPIMPPKDEEPLTPTGARAHQALDRPRARSPRPAWDEPSPRSSLTLPPALVKPVRAVAVSPDGKIVAAGRGNKIHLYKATGDI